jgi:hypothetical protein
VPGAPDPQCSASSSGVQDRARLSFRPAADRYAQTLTVPVGPADSDEAERLLQAGVALDDELAGLLRRDPDNQRLLDGVGAQHDRGRLLRFLAEDGVEPRLAGPATGGDRPQTLALLEKMSAAPSLRAFSTVLQYPSQD